MHNVFDALADPTRRQILDRLRARGPLSVSEIAAPLEMSRQGATKHLDRLVASGLVKVAWQGRSRLHELDPEPLREVDDWLAPYAAEWDRRLERLRRHLDGPFDSSPDPSEETS